MTHSNHSPPSRVLFASSHCLMDFSSGVAIATADALKLLAQRGFECRAFSASKLDLEAEESFEQILADAKIRAQSQTMAVGNRSMRLLRVLKGAIPVAVFRTRSTRIDQWSPGECEAMLAAFERIAGDFRPDVLLTYGGDPATQTMIRLTQQRGIPVVFALHNFAYHDASMFRGVDYVIVPSEFSQRWYQERLGLRCEVLPYAIDWERVCVRGADRVRGRQGEQDRAGKPQSATLNSEASPFVTLVNPQPAKGVFVFARIAEQLQRRRPDIPILVVESRGVASWLEHTDIDLSWATNLHAMANTHDPRDFYAVTKVLLMPSLWNESVGLVAAEAMINGIPVLASDRGALPETLGRVVVIGDWPPARRDADASEISGQSSIVSSHLPKGEPTASGGFLFHIPTRYTPETTAAPTADDVERWVETIIRLWDDENLYRECSEKAIAHAQRWHPDRLGPMYAEFFRNVRP